MGNTLGFDEGSSFTSQSFQQIKDEYFISENQLLTHKFSNKQYTLHYILASSKEEALIVQKNIEKYEKSVCNSISNLKQYHCSKKDGYCTNQKKYYIIFQHHSSPNVKEQYLARRHKKMNFTDLELESILSCMICGMKQYCESFNRKESAVDLESIIIVSEQDNALKLKDPWLFDKKINNSPTPIDFFAKYPSPQKIDASNNYMFQSFDNFSSNLFSIGIYGLQLHTMNFRDDVYARKKYVDYKIIHEHLRKIKNQRIKEGLALLLSDNVYERNQILNLWGINCYRRYYLKERVCSEYIGKDKNLYKQKINFQDSFIDFYPRKIGYQPKELKNNEPERVIFENKNEQKTNQNLFYFPQIDHRNYFYQNNQPNFHFTSIKNQMHQQNQISSFNKNKNFLIYENLDRNQMLKAKYEGQKLNNMKQGKGKIYYMNGDIFQGTFSKDQAEGVGIYRYQDGRKIEGIWNNSKLVKIFGFVPANF